MNETRERERERSKYVHILYFAYCPSHLISFTNSRFFFLVVKKNSLKKYVFIKKRLKQMLDNNLKLVGFFLYSCCRKRIKKKYINTTKT